MLFLHLGGRPHGFDTGAEDGTVFDGGWAKDGTISDGGCAKDGTVLGNVRVLKLEAEYNASSFSLSTVSDVSDTHAVSVSADDGTVFDGGYAKDGTVSANDGTVFDGGCAEDGTVSANDGTVFDGGCAKDGTVSADDATDTRTSPSMA